MLGFTFHIISLCSIYIYISSISQVIICLFSSFIQIHSSLGCHSARASLRLEEQAVDEALDAGVGHLSEFHPRFSGKHTEKRMNITHFS